MRNILDRNLTFVIHNSKIAAGLYITKISPPCLFLPPAEQYLSHVNFMWLGYLPSVLAMVFYIVPPPKQQPFPQSIRAPLSSGSHPLSGGRKPLRMGKDLTAVRRPSVFSVGNKRTECNRGSYTQSNINFARQPSHPRCLVPAPAEVREASGPSAPASHLQRRAPPPPPSHFLPSLIKV